MTELLKNAWLGWQNYIQYGKLAALFLAAVVYLILRGKKDRSAWQLTVYGAAAGALCIFPPTAACLMLYQTRFFDYEWIWSCVPVTALIALGGTVFLSKYRIKYNQKFKNICYNISAAVFAVVILLLSGGLGQSGTEFSKGQAKWEKAAQVLEQTTQICDAGEICLWAPREILEYVRAQNGDIRLLYGRNMWDTALNAYSYDTYSQELEALYQWMEQLTGPGEGEDLAIDRRELPAEGAACIQKALSLGANCVLLPGNISAEEIAKLTSAQGMPEGLQTVWLDNYYLITVLEAAYE